METKICSICKIRKPLSAFSKDSSHSDGLQCRCRVCDREKETRYKHSLKGFLHRLYNTQKKSSKRRGHQPPTYTFDELKDWFITQPNFKTLWRQWKNNNYDTKLKPSIDRLDNNKGYSLDNIRLVTWEENRLKEVNNKKRKVNQYTLEGKYIKTFDSLTEASKVTQCNLSTIFTVCRNKQKTACGFIWRYTSTSFPENRDITKVVI